MNALASVLRSFTETFAGLFVLPDRTTVAEEPAAPGPVPVTDPAGDIDPDIPWEGQQQTGVAVDPGVQAVPTGGTGGTGGSGGGNGRSLPSFDAEIDPDLAW